jgi:hypothetical protein
MAASPCVRRLTGAESSGGERLRCLSAAILSAASVGGIGCNTLLPALVRGDATSLETPGLTPARLSAFAVRALRFRKRCMLLGDELTWHSSASARAISAKVQPRRRISSIRVFEVLFVDPLLLA